MSFVKRYIDIDFDNSAKPLKRVPGTIVQGNNKVNVVRIMYPNISKNHVVIAFSKRADEVTGSTFLNYSSESNRFELTLNNWFTTVSGELQISFAVYSKNPDFSEEGIIITETDMLRKIYLNVEESVSSDLETPEDESIFINIAAMVKAFDDELKEFEEKQSTLETKQSTLETAQSTLETKQGELEKKVNNLQQGDGNSDSGATFVLEEGGIAIWEEIDESGNKVKKNPLGDGVVTTEKIEDKAVSLKKLDATLQETLKNLVEAEVEEVEEITDYQGKNDLFGNLYYLHLLTIDGKENGTLLDFSKDSVSYSKAYRMHINQTEVFSICMNQVHLNIETKDEVYFYPEKDGIPDLNKPLQDIRKCYNKTITDFSPSFLFLNNFFQVVGINLGAKPSDFFVRIEKTINTYKEVNYDKYNIIFINKNKIEVQINYVFYVNQGNKISKLYLEIDQTHKLEKFTSEDTFAKFEDAYSKL